VRRTETAHRKAEWARRRVREAPERLPSFEERALSERPALPERLARPEDRGRYAVPEPATSHERLHTPPVDAYSLEPARRRQALLPDRIGLSAVQRAVVWSEVLGPPKGLGE
jgi:hypothetical protein